MKICLPVGDNNGVDSIVFGHFGSAPFFAVFDTESQSVVLVNNNESEHEHGSCMPVDALRKLKAEAVLCKGMSMRAANLLIEAGIKPYLVDAETVADAINAYKSMNVKLLDARNACQGHDCH
jgi:predicted Fe-Mo cluster-binding NifX family protein